MTQNKTTMSMKFSMNMKNKLSNRTSLLNKIILQSNMYFIRHAETDWNRAKKCMGRVDISDQVFLFCRSVLI